MINHNLIERIICIGEGALPEEIKVKTRKREIVFTRQLIIYFDKIYTKASWAKIANNYGKDHATAIHAFKTIKNLYDTDRQIRLKIDLYDVKLKTVDNFEKELVIDKLDEIKELMKTLIDTDRTLSYDIILIYNKLVEKNEEILIKNNSKQQVLNSFI